MYIGTDVKKSYEMEIQLHGNIFKAISHTIGRISSENAQDTLPFNDPQDESEEVITVINSCVVASQHAQQLRFSFLVDMQSVVKSAMKEFMRQVSPALCAGRK